jgi:hypothetical protein
MNSYRFAVDCVWNVMAHAQKPDFVFRQNGRVHLNRQGLQFSRLLAGELCTSACRGCTARASLCSAVMWRLLVTHSILLFPLHFSYRASPCAITFQKQSTCTSLSFGNKIIFTVEDSAQFRYSSHIRRILYEKDMDWCHVVQNRISDGHLCTRHWNVGFYNIWTIFWVAEHLLDTQKLICCIVSYFVF